MHICVPVEGCEVLVRGWRRKGREKKVIDAREKEEGGQACSWTAAVAMHHSWAQAAGQGGPRTSRTPLDPLVQYSHRACDGGPMPWRLSMWYPFIILGQKPVTSLASCKMPCTELLNMILFVCAMYIRVHKQWRTIFCLYALFDRHWSKIDSMLVVKLVLELAFCYPSSYLQPDFVILVFVNCVELLSIKYQVVVVVFNDQSENLQ